MEPKARPKNSYQATKISQKGQLFPSKNPLGLMKTWETIDP
jgi:hypothetical protein